jgi:DNA-binding LacI/PurR family transcriptional regulator
VNLVNAVQRKAFSPSRFAPTDSDPTPLADQLVAFIQEGVITGELSAGTPLPPADGWPAAGRSTVLQAYRQLRDEGMVSMLPSRGTVIRPVTQRRRCAVIVDTPEAEHYSAFDLQIQVEVMDLFAEEGVDLALYPISRHMRPGTGESACVSRELAADAAAGLLAGAVLSYSPKFPKVLEWLTRRGIPVVSTRDFDIPDMPHIRLDGRVLLENGLRRLASLGHRRILLLNTHAAPLPEIPGLHVRELRHETVSQSAMSIGQRLAGDWGSPVAAGEFDAVFVTDDWVALGFLLVMRAQGIRLPGAAAMLVACNSGQLSEAFDGCDKMLLSTRKIAEKILELYQSVTTKGAAPVDPNVVHTFVPGRAKDV